LKPYPFSSDNGGLVIKARIPEDIIFRGVGGKACVGLWGFFWGVLVWEKGLYIV
jgi:hypothetical protein